MELADDGFLFAVRQFLEVPALHDIRQVFFDKLEGVDLFFFHMVGEIELEQSAILFQILGVVHINYIRNPYVSNLVLIFSAIYPLLDQPLSRFYCLVR